MKKLVQIVRDLSGSPLVEAGRTIAFSGFVMAACVVAVSFAGRIPA